MRHLISLVPSTTIDPVLRTRIGTVHGIPGYRIAAIERHPQYAALRRRSLILGASDGARLDQLRRVSRLSHEQFLQSPSPSIGQLQKLAEKLANAPVAADGERRFEHVFLVDDFSGSGRTLIRKQEQGDAYEGKIVGLLESLTAGAQEGLIVENVPGTIVLYCASQQAIEQVQRCLAQMNLANWTVQAVQVLPYALKVTDRFPEMAQLCGDFFDESSVDDDKKRAPIGYSDCALPVVLSHNAPNNSVCLLWLDTRDREDGSNLRALFPRYERHHPDRR